MIKQPRLPQLLRGKRKPGLKTDLKKLSGSLTHGTRFKEPSLMALNAKAGEISGSLPHRGTPDAGKLNPRNDGVNKNKSMIKARGKRDLMFDKKEANQMKKQQMMAMAKGGHWIQGAIKHPGALHEQLGVPAGKKIPSKKLMMAEHSSNPLLRKRANLAATLKKMHKPQGR